MPRIILAKPGLDGHDRGAKLVARLLRDDGWEVIYTGIRQKPTTIAAIAVQEDVDVVGLSILSGAHLGLTRKVRAALDELGASDVPIAVGGTVPASDVAAMLAAGASAVLPTGTRTDTLLMTIRSLVEG
jgi:methylmalonyl-CoA mutase C-terminal domain/subunit